MGNDGVSADTALHRPGIEVAADELWVVPI